mmetsp:Transcript_38156/g.88811  ORF Transcript_38156/g.88811 Transcript_38156/m.88811 type:complete len:224 (-) Transcript_38156:1227-1898(-)
MDWGGGLTREREGRIPNDSWTIAAPPSNRWPQAGLVSRLTTWQTLIRYRSRWPRAPSPAREGSFPVSRFPNTSGPPDTPLRVWASSPLRLIMTSTPSRTWPSLSTTSRTPSLRGKSPSSSSRKWAWELSLRGCQRRWRITSPSQDMTVALGLQPGRGSRAPAYPGSLASLRRNRRWSSTTSAIGCDCRLTDSSRRDGTSLSPVSSELRNLPSPQLPSLPWDVS